MIPNVQRMARKIPIDHNFDGLGADEIAAVFNFLLASWDRFALSKAAIEGRNEAYRHLGGLAALAQCYRSDIGVTQSPIEREMYRGLIGRAASWGNWSLQIQHRVQNYKIDLAFLRRDNEQPVLAIECDGHDYHERTKEQAAHDRSRDRVLLGLGIKTIRFTGSEIYRRGGDDCAREAIALAASVDRA